jgi:hypothetical protein
VSSSDEDDEDVWLCDDHYVVVSDNQEPISHTRELLRRSRPHIHHVSRFQKWIFFEFSTHILYSILYTLLLYR